MSLVEGRIGGEERENMGRGNNRHLVLSMLLSGLSWQFSLKESVCNTGDPGSVPGSERSPAGGHGNPL